MTDQILKVTPSTLNENLTAEGKVHLIDVRSPSEFRALHVDGAENLPLDQLNEDAFNKLKTLEGDLFFICAAGTRSQSACEKAIQAGITKIHTVEGGTLACKKSGLVVNESNEGWSLERQVRFAAGLLVLLGTLGSLFIHPRFIGLAIFVGAGQVFASLTNWCGMGLLLARMPWNR